VHQELAILSYRDLQRDSPFVFFYRLAKIHASGRIFQVEKNYFHIRHSEYPLMQSEISLGRRVKKFLPVTIAAFTIGCAGMDTGEMLKTTVQGLAGTGPYSNQNVVATYYVTKQHVHIATRKLGKGMVAAVTALGIKNDVDVPQFITDAKVANGSDALTAKAQKENTEIMNFSKKASEAIAKKLDKPFTLSAAAKKELAAAMRLVRMGQILNSRAVSGAALLAQRIATRDPMQDLKQAASANPAVFAVSMIKNILAAPTDIKAGTDNFKKVVGGFDKIKETKSTKDVEVAKKEAIEKDVDKELETAISKDMKSARG